MKIKLFSVFDSKVGAYMQPFYARTSGEAVRSFQDAIVREGSQFGTHAEDFTLFELGTWDDVSAQIEMLPTPHSLGVASEFKAAVAA